MSTSLLLTEHSAKEQMNLWSVPQNKRIPEHDWIASDAGWNVSGFGELKLVIRSQLSSGQTDGDHN